MEGVSYRELNVEGFEKVLWVTEDVMAFGAKQLPEGGPLYDWIVSRDDILSYCKGRKTVIQAGGNCGMYPMFYSKYFEKVFTAEPDERNFYCLAENIKDLQNVTAFHAAFGNTNSRCSIVDRGTDKNVGLFRVNQVGSDKPIAMITIDSLNLDYCDLIHLDVEGYEGNILDGAKKTIEKFKPVIVLEHEGSDQGSGYNHIPKYKKAKQLHADTIYIYNE